MRLRDKEAHQRQVKGVLTMGDMVKKRREDAAADKRAEEKKRNQAKAATKGTALDLGGE